MSQAITQGLHVMVTDEESPFKDWGGDVVAVREGGVIIDASYMGWSSPTLRLTFNETALTVLAPLSSAPLSAWERFKKWKRECNG